MFREHTHDTTTGAAERGFDRGSSGSILPKVIAVVAVVGLLRMLASHKRTNGGTSSWRDQRRKMVGELHRELHRHGEAEAGTLKA
jgi:hypothetical protein